MMAEARWPGFGYVQVPGLANRFIARWLRTQRKNMTRFFYDRGLLDLALRMEQIKASRQGMMAKNRMFQKVLDDYSKIANPAVGTTAPAAAEAAPVQEGGSVVLPDGADSNQPGDGDHGGGPVDGSGVPVVEAEAVEDGPLVEE